MKSDLIEPTCIYCRNCIPREDGYECYAFGNISHLSPQHARACKYFELPGVPCRTMKKMMHAAKHNITMLEAVVVLAKEALEREEKKGC